VQALLPDTGTAIPGRHHRSPGVGKSTTIDVARDVPDRTRHKVAVLAVDPLRRHRRFDLADKTRMARLSGLRPAYIRPSPDSGTLGGVAAKTRERCCCARPPASTWCWWRPSGSGNPETVVCDMTDFFLALMRRAPATSFKASRRAGRIGRMIAVTRPTATISSAPILGRRRVRGALHILTPRSDTGIRRSDLSALIGTGIAELWQKIIDHRTAMNAWVNSPRAAAHK